MIENDIYNFGAQNKLKSFIAYHKSVDEPAETTSDLSNLVEHEIDL